MRTTRRSWFAVASVFALLILAALASAPPAPAGAPRAQVPPTSTPTPTPTPVMPLPPPLPPLPPGVISGDPHLRTMDGFGYDFQAVGEYVALEATTDDLQVQVRQEPWSSSSVVSVVTAIAMNVAGDHVGISTGVQTSLQINGEPTVLESGSLSLPQGGRVERQGAYFTIVWPDQSALTIGVSDAYLDVIARLAPARAGQVAGLLGNADGDPANDLATRDGVVIALAGLPEADIYRRVYQEFAPGWRVAPDTSLFASAGNAASAAPPQPTAEAGAVPAGFPSALVDASDLPPWTRQAAEAICRQAGVEGADILADCILDVGLTGQEAFAASAARVEDLLALPAEPTVFAFEGALAPAAAMYWRGAETNTIKDSGTMQIRVELDPAQQIAPVRRVEASIELIGDDGGGACRWVWESRQLVESWWDESGSVNFRVDGDGVASCWEIDRPEQGWEQERDAVIWFQGYITDDRTLVLCPDAYVKIERSECLEYPTALLVRADTPS